MSPTVCKIRGNRPYAAAVIAAAVAGFGLNARAATYSFDGGPTGTGTELGTAANWTLDTIPNGATNDVAQFDETLAGNLSLTYNVAAANLGNATGILLNVTGGHTGTLAIDGTITSPAIRLGPGNAINVDSGAGAVTFGNGSGTFQLTLAQVTATLNFTNNSASAVTFNSDVRFANGNAADHTIQLAGTGNWVFNNNLTPNNSGVINLIKTGSGTATFGSTSNLGTGTLTFAGGVSNINGALGTNATAGGFRVGTVSGTSAVVNFGAGSTLGSRANLFVGDAGTGTGGGAVYQNGGTLALTQAAGVDNLRVGSNSGGYGYYKLAGGTLTTNEAGIAASLADTVGVMDVTGGTFTDSGYLAIGRGSATSSGLYNANGGTTTAARIHLNYAGTGGAISVLNVGSAVSTTGSTTAGVDLANGTVAGTLGVVNLRPGGTLTTGLVTASQANPTAVLNFSGGTLKATATNAGNGFLTSANVDAVNVFAAGGTIDNGGTAVTVGRPLLTPAGFGVNATNVSVASGGAGYIGAPLVKLTGGSGTGATGYATMTGGVVTGIVITSPGTGYASTDTLTATFFGGGATTAAPAVTGIGVAANTGGGMTFAGTGLTTLTAVNTYPGATLVTGGLALGGSGSINTSSGITVNGAGAQFVQNSSTAVTPAISLVKGTLDGTGTVGAVTVAAGTGGVVAGGSGTGGTLTAGSLNFTGNAAALFTLAGGTNVTTAPLNVTGALTTSGTVTVSATAPLTDYVNGATYRLIGYGSFAGSLSNFAVGSIAGLTSRQAGVLGDTGSAITLTIVGDAPKWNGLDSGNWQVGTTGPNGNWKLSLTGAPTDYIQGDVVVFDDTAAGTTAVNINAANVSPTSTTFSNSTLTYTVAGPFGISGTGDLTKTGTASVTLATTNTYTGDTVVNRGTLSLTGKLGATAVTVAPAAGQAAVMNSSGTVALGSGAIVTRVGTFAGGTAVLNVTAGAFGGGTAAITAGDGGFGTINVSGGAVTPGQFVIAGTGASGSVGIWNLSGGTVVANGAVGGGTLGATAGTTGVMNVTGTGSYTSNAAVGTSGLYVGEAGAGVLNVSGNGSLTLGGTSTAPGLDIGRNNVGTASGIVNLGGVGSGGGTITTNVIRHSGAAATGTLNFHGGTLKASSLSISDGDAGSGNSFMGGLTAAYVYGEGGTVDNSGRSITIDQDLSTPGGSGVTAIAVGTGGAGYVTAPLITITGGGGTGATAVATVSGGAITGFTITNPGTGYTTTPTITLIGGTDSGVAATVGAVTRLANVSGGMTFVGTGTTVLGGTNTYTGATAVTAGTLVITGGSAIADTAAVTVAAGATLGVSGSETIGSLAGSGTVLIGGVAQTLTVGASNANTAFAGNIFDATSGALTKTGSGTLTLGGINEYAGATTVAQGTLGVSSILRNTGVGAGINLGSGSGTGTLLYTGTGEVSPKSIFLSAGAAANGGTIDMSGTNKLEFAGATLAANASQLHTLTLQGSTTGVGQIDGVISDGSATNKTSLLKQGTGTWVLAGANTYTGATTINGGTLQLGTGVAGQDGTIAAAINIGGSGRLVFNRAAASTAANAISGGGAVTKIGPGMQLLTGANTYTGVTTVNGGTLEIGAAARNPLLTNAGGVDLQSGRLVFDYSGVSVVATIRTILTAGYDSGFATGPIRATTLAAGLTIGYGDDGVSAVTLRLTLPGDANLDGQVDFNDFIALQTNYLAADARFDQGNFNYDNVVDFNDFIAIQTNYGQSVTGTSVAFTQEQVGMMNAFAMANAVVPEPASVALLGVAGALLGRRRRR